MSIIKRLLIQISAGYFALLDQFDSLLGRPRGEDASIEQLAELQLDGSNDSPSDFALVDVRSVASKRSRSSLARLQETPLRSHWMATQFVALLVNIFERK